MRALVQYLGRHHVGLLALFIALSGTAYASGVARNSVGTAQLKQNAVTSPKVKDGSLRVSDFARADRAGLRGAAGAQGAPGAAGARGASGPTGPSGRDGGGVIDVQWARPQPDPPAQPQGQGSALTFDLPAAGKVNLNAFVQALGACPAGGADCVFSGGLYLDGKPVPGSGFEDQSAPAGASDNACNAGYYFSFGGYAQVAGVAAGRHTLTVGYQQTSGPRVTVTLCPTYGDVTGPYQ